MATFSVNRYVIERLAASMYGLQLGSATLNEAVTAANYLASFDAPGSDGMNRLMNVLYARDFATQTTAAVAKTFVANLGITGALATSSEALVKSALDAAAAADRGAVLVTIVNKFAAAEADASYGPAAKAFNAQIETALAWSTTHTADVAISALVPIFNLDPASAAGADVMHLTGNQDVRIDFTNRANQVTGLDLNGDGLIATNGVENVVTGKAADYEIVDAYSRNPLNHLDTANNFLGDIAFDGTAYKGDGVSTNGNIFLGGLGADVAFGGVGNDFLAGGAIAQGHGGRDVLRGGRNADFFFAEFSGIDATDGGGANGSNTLMVDGGNTADNSSAGQTGSSGSNNSTSQDQDWLLFEASDDDEPVQITLNENQNAVGTPTTNEVQSRAGESMTLRDVENFDASGNLYGFLDNVDVEIGGRAADDRDASAADVGYNYGYGSSAQLRVTGSEVANIIVAGYDNDWVSGGVGADILFGGNLKFLNNPNSVGIVNDGRDELYGGADSDAIVFEADGGIVDGDTGTDTLFLTNYALGTKSAADLTSDGVLRFDLESQVLDSAAGYGGANVNGTQDQTNYKSGITGGRVTTTNMESVVATGMGVIDYKAAGANTPELLFTNQQNQMAYSGALDLRGTSGANTLYATDGADVLEGRAGNDNLSGGGGNDDFYFATMTSAGTNGADGVDVIHRQTDKNADNIWDTSSTGANLFERDFNIGGTSTTGASSLTVDLGTTNLASADVAMTSFTVKIDGKSFAVTDAGALLAANSAAEVAALVNTAYKAIDAKVTAVAVGNTIVVTDAGGRDISDTVAEGYAVGGVVSNGAFSALATFNAAGTSTTKDRLIYKSYEDRLDNEGTDDDSVLGSTISLGTDAYAEDVVINFADEDGNGLATTRIAEDQSYKLVFKNLTTQDKVTVDVNGVKYSLQVGVDLDGNVIANEDGVGGDTQNSIQHAFLNRLTAFINSFMDDDTSAGKVAAAVSSSAALGAIGVGVDLNADGDVLDGNEPAVSDTYDTITLTQAAYNGEQTVFMVKPTVSLQNLSGGETASVTVTNTSQHEVELLDFDGRNGELNETNVLFVGQEFISRSELSTALNAGGTQTGNEATVIDVGANNLQDVVFGTTTAIPNNTASNSPLSTVPNGVAVHGDDFLLGGAGLDTINGGTGDDRVEGSVGGDGSTTWDTLDGGKNFYAVQVLGESQARVYVLNKWEAANPSKVTALSGLTLSSVTLINQSESGTGTVSGVFDDTLQFSQKNFTSGATRFTVALTDFTVTGGVVELRNDGAGTVGVDVNGDGTIDNWTKFTNFENIRTVSGTGNAVAKDGQGNDTLDVTLLSSTTTGAGGVSYDLTNGGGAGEVRYSTNVIIDTVASGDPQYPTSGDYEALVIKVDGVESVLASTGNDLLTIDETEAAKDNTFNAGLGIDRIDYQNTYTGAVAGIAEPTVTIALDNVAASLGGTDTVTMTGGRVGATLAVDTLGGVEYIQLGNETAQGSREDDVLDVTMMSAGAVVSYVDGTVKDLAGVTHVTVQGLDEIENIWSAGTDTVIVADAGIMSGNGRSDAGTAAGTDNVDLALATFIDFDTLKNAGTDNSRKAFASQTTTEIEDVINQNQFKFNLSKTGTGADTDTVDYSNAADAISVVVELDATKPNQYVLVDSDGTSFYDAVGDMEEAGDRVDQLVSVERIVASLNESVLDLSGSTKGLEIKWSAFDLASQNATLDRDVYSVRISDLSTASPLQRTFVEYRDAGLSSTVSQGQATWNRIEGSDNAETVIANSAHAMDADTFNLRGGVNTVKYNELTKSITLSLSVSDFSAASPLTTGKVTGDVQFQDGTGAGVEGPFIAGSQHHTITSYTANNGIASGSLRIAASQDAEDTLKFSGGLSDKVFLISEVGTIDNQITVKLGSGSAQNSVILTGFELVSDANTNDIYDFGSLLNAGAGLNFIDSAGDHDTVKVGNDAIDFDGTNALAGGAVLAGATEISLGAIRDNGTLAAAGFDFDVLDLTKVTNTTVLTVTGALASGEFNTDEVVFGAVNNINSALGFESVVFTQATVAENGTSYVLNTTANSITAGAKTIALTNGANTLSFGGTVLEQTGNSLRAATDLNATSGVTVTITGAEAVNLTGGNGNDSLTGGAGADVLRGGSGADTLNGSFVAEAVEVHTYTISANAGLTGGAGRVVTINGVSVTEGAVVAGVTVAEDDADSVGAAFVRVWNATPAAFTNGQAAGPNNEIGSVTYDALTNALTFTFTSAAGDVNDALLGAPAGTGAAAATAETLTTAYAARGESADRYVFEATAALNGSDTILNFNSTDTLDFRAFFADALGVSQLHNSISNNDLTGGYNLVGFGNTINVTYNKATLAAEDFGGTTGHSIGNNTKHIFITTGDANNAADATNDGYKVYVVTDSDAGAGITYQVDLIGSFTPNTELTNGQIATMG